MNNKQAKKLRKAAKAIASVQPNVSVDKAYNDLKQIHLKLNKNEKMPRL
jgi:hypothetical protein